MALSFIHIVLHLCSHLVAFISHHCILFSSALVQLVFGSVTEPYAQYLRCTNIIYYYLLLLLHGESVVLPSGFLSADTVCFILRFEFKYAKNLFTYFRKPRFTYL